jgi:hypothetical protein
MAAMRSSWPFALLVAAAPLVPLLASGQAPTRGDTPAVQEVTGDTMQVTADDLAGKMQRHLKDILDRIKKAYAASDVSLLNCLNDKLNRIKPLVRIGEQSRTGLSEFLARGQVEAASYEKDKIVLAQAKVQEIWQESTACVSEGSSIGGNTTVTVERPGYPGDPTHLDGPSASDDLDPPPSASIYN